MPPDTAEQRIVIESDADVVTARQRARELAAGLELTSTDQTLLATAISEVARNITTYATRGEVLLSVVRDNGGREGIRVVARDEDAYRYLAESIRRFPDQQDLAERMRSTGFEKVAWRNLSAGIAAVHSGWRF